jgi:hypothetical protein
MLSEHEEAQALQIIRILPHPAGSPLFSFEGKNHCSALASDSALCWLSYLCLSLSVRSSTFQQFLSVKVKAVTTCRPEVS